MKKVFALILALVMVLSLSCVAFADTINSTDSGSNFETNDVTVGVASGTTVNIYHINIVWTDANATFTYGMGTKTWEPSTHSYKTTGNGWSKGGVGIEGNPFVKVEVYNHSDLPVKATLAADGTLPTGITGSVTNFPDTGLASAVGTSVDQSQGATGTTPYAYATYTLVADPELVTASATTTISLTVTISKVP